LCQNPLITAKRVTGKLHYEAKLELNSTISKKTDTEETSRERPFQCLSPILLPTWEAESERITVQGQLRQLVLETPSLK
jgi:hypothetical protein